MNFPTLEREPLATTRDALHAYAKVLGAWLKHCRGKRKHWWHASLRPSLNGITTGVVYGPAAFELELNLRESVLKGTASSGAALEEPLRGQSSGELSQTIDEFLAEAGVTDRPELAADSARFDYAPDQARLAGQAFHAIAAALTRLRARIPEEASPLQVWPHHFDLSMIWLPGEKIFGQDPTDEENSDKQMNFGFTLGDADRPDPYLYVTAYPSPEAMTGLHLPAGTRWITEGFTGAILPYATLINEADPDGYLQTLWEQLIEAAREHQLETKIMRLPT